MWKLIASIHLLLKLTISWGLVVLTKRVVPKYHVKPCLSFHHRLGCCWDSLPQPKHLLFPSGPVCFFPEDLSVLRSSFLCQRSIPIF